MLGLTFASRYPIALQAITIVIVEAIIRKNPKYLVRVLIGAIPIILFVVLAVYNDYCCRLLMLSPSRYSIHLFLHPHFICQIGNKYGDSDSFLAPLALLFRRTWMDKYNYTFIAWFIIALLFWSSNS